MKLQNGSAKGDENENFSPLTLFFALYLLKVVGFNDKCTEFDLILHGFDYLWIIWATGRISHIFFQHYIFEGFSPVNSSFPEFIVLTFCIEYKGCYRCTTILMLLWRSDRFRPELKSLRLILNAHWKPAWHHAQRKCCWTNLQSPDFPVFIEESVPLMSRSNVDSVYFYFLATFHILFHEGCSWYYFLTAPLWSW